MCEKDRLWNRCAVLRHCAKKLIFRLLRIVLYDGIEPRCCDTCTRFLVCFSADRIFPRSFESHVKQARKRGLPTVNASMGFWGRRNSSWASRKTREIPFMFWLNSYRIVAPLENNCCSMVDREREQEHASMTRNCRSKNVEACSLATSQAGESGKCKIIKPLLVSGRHAPVSNNFSATNHHPSFCPPQQ